MKFDIEFVENGKYFKVLSKGKIDPSVEQPPFYDGKIKRIVILRKNPISDYFTKTLSEICHDDVPPVKGTDRGYLIAHSFQEFLLTTDELNSFKNEVNIFWVDKTMHIVHQRLCVVNLSATQKTCSSDILEFPNSV